MCTVFLVVLILVEKNHYNNDDNNAVFAKFNYLSGKMNFQQKEH